MLIESVRGDFGRGAKKYLCVAFVVVYVLVLIYATDVAIHDNIMGPSIFFEVLLVTALLFIPVLIVAFILWLISKNQLVVTDKRISGKAAFGKQVDLPVDSVSSVATLKLIKGLAIYTASGKVSFWAISNRDAIYKVISDLVIARQSKAAAPAVVQQSAIGDYTEELKKIKELLDMGVISQEEFDAKKKQILGL